MLMNSSKKSEHVLDTMHQNWFCSWGPLCCNFLPSYKIHERVLSMAKMHRIKKQHHFEKATVWDLQLWFVHFSSHASHVYVQRFTSELKCLNQRQGTLLSLLKWKDVDLKNLLFKEMLVSLIWCILSIEMDCLCRKELLGSK